MESNYKKLGEFIRPVDKRNSDLSITNLQGVSITKEFVPSIANTIGTDLSTYKIVRTGQFAYGPVTSRNGDKVSIALLKGEDCIISSSYVPFEVYKPDELLPEYLMLWFMRPEFDRYARFMSNGSAREVFDWDCMCGVELPVPSISEQRKIVHDYQVITDRIDLLEIINHTLFAVLDKLYNSWFVQYIPFGGECPSDWQSGKIDDIAEFYDYLRKPLSGEEREGMKKLYPYYGAISIVDYVDDFIFDDSYVLLSEDGANILDENGHPALQFIHGKAWVNNHAHVLKAKNGFTDASLYIFLSHTQMQTIVTGAAQPKINQENLRSFPIVIPSMYVLEEFNKKIDPVFTHITENTDEIGRLKKLIELFPNQIAKSVM